jgi:putative DNA primase/helicase
MSDYQKVLSRLEHVRQSGNKAMAKCPAHDDGSNSLSIKHLDNGKILIHCFAGCTGEEILSAAGLSWSDIYPDDGYKPEFSKATREEIDSAKYLMELVHVWASEGNLKPNESDRKAIYKAQAILDAAGVEI